MTGPGGIAYEVDRKTGQSWMLYGARKTAQQGNAPSRGIVPPVQQLPDVEVKKITGNAKIEYRKFGGRLYNGSNWRVTRIVVTLTAKEKDGSVRWARDYSENVTLPPLTTEDFSIEIIGDEGIGEANWVVKEAFGIPQ